jgi:hypothetical protein
MIYPLVRDLAVDGIPVTVTCRVKGILDPGIQQVAPQPGLPTGLGRCSPHQPCPRYSPRRSRVRVSVRLRRDR